jgi:hypothetical protein
MLVTDKLFFLQTYIYVGLHTKTHQPSRPHGIASFLPFSLHLLPFLAHILAPKKERPKNNTPAGTKLHALLVASPGIQEKASEKNTLAYATHALTVPSFKAS